MGAEEPANGTRGIFVTSGYGANTRQPFVNLQVGDLKPVQMSPAEARDVALNLLAGAEAADQDGFLMTFYTEKVGMELERAAQMLLLYRQYREERAGG